MEELNDKLIDLGENLLIDDHEMWLQVTEWKTEKGGARV